jgi:hypothetical protein
MAGRSMNITQLALLALAVTAAFLIGGGIARMIYTTPSAVGAQEAPARSPGRQVAHLYFADARERHLVAEQRMISHFADDVALSRRLIELLVQGPTQGGSRTLPAGAGLRALFITGAGTVYLDFEAEAFSGHPGGAAAELLSIYSIVNTLVLNVDSVRSVKFLIGGHEAATLVGHVDLQDAFEVDMLWVR